MTSDLRSFLTDARKAGFLYEATKEVDPHKNVAALCDESDRPITFDHVAGYDGWTVAANLANNRDTEAVAFGVSRDEVVGHMAQAFDRGPTPHKVVESGPVKEVIWRDEDADVTRLPAVINSELDGGPYISAGIGVVIDPDTGLHNTTFPRFQVGDGRECPLYIYSPHVRAIMGKYAKRGLPMPMALVIGHHPAWEFAAASSVHHPRCGELDYVGSMLDEETEFVRCETIDVTVPAYAEIVIEGEVLTNEVRDEGPFGNYVGTYTSGPMTRNGIQKAPYFKVKCITTRQNPIFRHLQATVWTDHQRLVNLSIEANLYTALLESGIEVHDVYSPNYAGCSLTVVQMTPRGVGDAQDALMKAVQWENTTLGFMSHLALAVNRDVNIYDARDLMWALTIRANWAKDVTVVPGTRSSPLMPASEKIPGQMMRVAGKGMIDATHLPPKDDTAWWDLYRAWPQGKGTVSLEDYVDKFSAPSMRMQRMVAPQTPPGR